MPGVYYPSALVQLRVRVEETGGSDGSDLLSVVRDAAAPASAPATQGPESVADPRPDDRYALVAGVVPKSVRLRLGSVREADEASVTLDAGYLPFDPRLVRQVAVDVFIGAVLAEDYEAGNALVEPSRRNLRFRGWCDDGTWSLGEGEVSLECRGFGALLLDSSVRPAHIRGIDYARPLHRVVYDLVQASPMAAGMRVVARAIASEGDIPDLTQVLPRHLRRVQGKKGTMPIADGAESVLDLITRLCLLVGWVPRVELDELVLQPARTLWRGRREGERRQLTLPEGRVSDAPEPFRRTLAGGEELGARRLIWGEQIEDLEFQRPWATSARSPIELRAYVPRLERVLTVRYPPSLTPARVAPSGRVATEEVVVLTVAGIEDEATLYEVARNIWHERALRDVRGSLSTSDLASHGARQEWGRPGAEHDLLALRPGDTIEIRVAADTQSSWPELLEGLSRPRLVRLLQENGLPADVATRWAQAMRESQLSNFWRVAGVEFDWSAEDGLRIVVPFSAYLNAGTVDAP